MVTVNIDVTGFKFEDMKEYVETKTHSVVTELYYFNKGKDLGDYILVELKSGYDFDNSDDEFSDVASLDHLSEGEEELRQVRIKKRKRVEEKNKSSEDVYDESRIVFHNEDAYDESRLVLHNDSDDNDCEIDPLFSNLDDDSKKDKVHVEPEINSDEDMPIMDVDEIVYDHNKRVYPIYDPNIHWKLKKPILGELYLDLDQVKDCLTFYFVANGYQLWYEKSDSEKLLVRSGFDEKERRKKKLPRDPNKPCCPFRLLYVKMHDGNSWHIRTLVDEHTCTRQYILGCLVTSKWIARQCKDKIRMNPDLKVTDLQEMVVKKYRLLTKDLGLADGHGITFISDRHKGLIQAVRRVVPRVEQRLCARHIYANFKKVYPGVLFRNLFWQASKAFYHQKFKNTMEEIKTASAEAYQYLVDKDPSTWSRAYFKGGMDCDAVENGLSESFNSHIKNARRKPIIGMLEDIRSYVMTRNYTLRKECEDWKSDICPNIRKVLDLHKKIQRIWTLSPSGWHQFEVRQGNAMYFINTNPDDYVSESFKVSTYKSIYAFNIFPIDGMNMWRKIKHVPCKPPLERRMPGRPPVNRKKDKSEMKIQKHVARPPRSMTCKNCGENGHNKNGCEKPKVHGEEANPVNARVTSQSKYNFVTARGGIWMGGTSASGSSRGRGNASGSSRGRGSASGSNRGRGRASGSNKVVVKKPVVERYILLDEDDLVDIQVEEEVDTRYENVASEAAEQDEKEDEAARLKKRTRHIL
ncbi:cellulose synthase [Tanacetum coccineum]